MSGTRFLALMAAAVGVVAVIVAGVYFYQKDRVTRPTLEPKLATEQSQPSPPEPPKPPSEPPAAASPPSKPTSVPSFDIVRIEPTGEGVLAGLAEPGWTVKVESGETQIAETTADGDGAWSVVLDKPLASGEHSLTLKAISPDGTRALTSQQPVHVSVGKAPGEQPAVAQNEPSPAQEPSKEEATPAPSGEPQTAAEQTKPAETPETKPEAPAEAAAPEELKPEQQTEASTIAESQPQPIVPDEAAPREPTKPPVRIRNVEYQDTGQDSGKISLSGVGDPNVHVFLFFDDEPLGDVIIGGDGAWVFQIEKKLGEGEHTIRADTYDEKTGVVAGRASVRMGRETEAAEPETAKQEPAAPQPEAAQPEVAQEEQESSQPQPVYPEGAPEAETSSPAPSSSVAGAELPSLSSQPQPVYPEDASVPEASHPEIAKEEPAPAQPEAAQPEIAKEEPVAPQPEEAQPEIAKEEPAAPQPEASPPPPSTPPVTAETPSEGERAQSKEPSVVFKSVDYEDTSPDSGTVALAGTGDAGARILLFLDNNPLGEVIIGSDGTWTFEGVKKLEEGEHIFRADRIDETTGMVVGQASIGIMRMEKPAEEQAAAPAPSAPEPGAGPEAAPGGAQAPSQPAPQVSAAEEAKPAAAVGKQAHRKRHRPRVYTVRRGDTLWEIAESYYGGGWHYRAIVRDNRRKIHNPNLIYPKQKFHIPAR